MAIGAAQIAVSGMLSDATWLAATASNLANQRSTQTAASSASGNNSVPYQPTDTIDISNGVAGGVTATYRASGGLVNSPVGAAETAVDPVQQSIDEIGSLRSFQFNAIALRTAEEMQNTAIDLHA